jgi:hypothetical protein
MTHKGKQLEAVKFIQALNVVHKYPLLPVLRSYISAAALAGKMIRIRGDDPASQVHVCFSIKLCAIFIVQTVLIS